MRRARIVPLIVVLLAGCTPSRVPISPDSTRPSAPAADSPLATCVDPAPTALKPLDEPLARDFSGGRVTATVSLDDGAFQARPAPSSATPQLGAGLAYCNLLAGMTATGFAMLDAARAHGVSFGLGVITVADSVLKPGPHLYYFSGSQTEILESYHARLAWLAVLVPDEISNCPSTRSSAPPHFRDKPLPPYQVIAVDANTGAAGIVYSARTYSLCGFASYDAPTVDPAMEFVSLPWTLVKRGPGPQAASITYQPRPCDQRGELPTFSSTGQPVVGPEESQPALVRVTLGRLLTTYGPAQSVPLLLRSATLSTNLPALLIHAPVGAEDAA